MPTTLTRDGAVGVLTMESPPANAYDTERLHELAGLVDEIRRDDGIRAVVIRSGLPKFFSAGADISVARNFNVTVDGEPRRLGKLHHKPMVIDRQVVIGGSFNYTGPANRLNDENIFVIGDLEEDDPESRQRQAALATYAAGEIDRIIRTHVP